MLRTIKRWVCPTKIGWGLILRVAFWVFVPGILIFSYHIVGVTKNLKHMTYWTKGSSRIWWPSCSPYYHEMIRSNWRCPRETNTSFSYILLSFGRPTSGLLTSNPSSVSPLRPKKVLELKVLSKFCPHNFCPPYFVAVLQNCP